MPTVQLQPINLTELWFEKIWKSTALKAWKKHYYIWDIIYEEKIIYSYLIKKYLQVLVDENDACCARHLLYMWEFCWKVLKTIGNHKHRDINRFEKILFYFNLLKIWYIIDNPDNVLCIEVFKE